MRIRRWIFVGIIILAAGYFFYEARGVIFNPKLEIFEPKDGAVLMSAGIHIAGKTDSNLAVWVAGKTFQSDEKGIFEGDLILIPGYNLIGVSVKDRFGGETRKVLKVIVK
ncbi:hypothetical protein A3B05_03620 [Candidatus Giovannonibacteria bacterium RIFCSPLOWO2_01_FULL_43_160]|uniref:Uncharacterized protein n=2 Tax=Candidatus Giovannoniibacteriota TaxID=1752738 RepID=A0A1F5XV59_9BACT|nr:MAG: hypothetical protein A2652_00525 [Candidatus Giovannonibacteria bacterium RIFCSPHIGHO2_01_FULL_43_140]OGF70299.1 MAG: hypothetical protein A3C76_01485 [Candidatus Giovannonibacteria bacterium RIFCSPHIGHO2_02_FULL_44_51]OGF71919.1 MAG: hypothetical protein A3E35_00695 [Candidatus Giovannonibacteria bacterium RIFCSPHIGHO2_12_FULL_44_22]OGF76889.1 MAG: hypothetical protein A3B05_03620 [Candidatus Giovannonibacteria bacterium RIFCSPLOWO2_01_FULL_43_160]OGF86456.1 MAG: hypothetical protein A